MVAIAGEARRHSIEGLIEVRARIAEAARRSGRTPGQVRLVAVSKGRPSEAVLEAYRAGQRDFGESRAQELVEKAPQLPGDIRWHFVGPLQRNKVSQVRPLVVMLHSLDRLSLARSWARGPGRPPPAFLELNVGGERQKLGVPPEQAEEVLAEIVALGVEVRGVMTIPPRVRHPAEARPYFLRMVEVRDRLARRWPKVRELSMGMSEDFEVAVEAGSTLVRVGRAIFGPIGE